MATEPDGQEPTRWKIHDERLVEAERVEWIPLDPVRDRITQGEIVGVASQVALLG